MKLLIDTRDNSHVVARLVDGDKTWEQTSNVTHKRPESILILIDKVCQQAGITNSQIDEINVEEGPGSYTGLKVGASVANALSFALQKPVNGKPIGEIIEPKYE